MKKMESALKAVMYFAWVLREKMLNLSVIDHIEKEHVDIKDSGLRARVWRWRENGNGKDGDPGIKSKFDRDADIFALASQVVEDNKDAIAKWYLKYGTYAEDSFESYFDHKVGYGYAACLPGFTPYRMSGVRIWVCIGEDGRIALKSVYPVPDPDEMDLIWDRYYGDDL